MLRTILEILITIWLAVSIAFVVLRWLPGDALEAALISSQAPTSEIESRRKALGLNEPIGNQYLHYWTQLVQGNLGVSIYSGLPVTEMIGQRWGSTVELGVGAALVATTLGIGLGVASGFSLGYGLSRIAHIMLRLSLSVPVYWTATMVVFVLVGPLGGLRNPTNRLLLPIVVLGFHSAGTIGRVLHTSIQSNLQYDFVRTARAKGLTLSTIRTRHVLRLALVSTIAVIVLQVGFLLGGTVITETIFSRPGLGKLMLEATTEQDYPVVQGLILVFSATYAILNALGRTLQAWLDPRITP